MNNGSKLKEATLYAVSMYDGAAAIGQQNAMCRNARDLIALLNENIEELKYLNSPMWGFAAKTEILETLAKKLNLCPAMLNTLKILAQKHKFNELPLILQKFVSVYNSKNNIIEVDVETVVELSSDQNKKLQEKLKKLLDKDIIINYQINPQIIGGLLIKYGTWVIDGSVKHKLDSLEQLMKGTK